jgi:branched-chain amino acid transport system substrate-binding protein
MKKLIPLFLFIAGLLTGCGTTQKIADKLPPVDPDVITIGAVLPMSGDYSVFGKSIENGLLLKIDEFNASGKKINGKKIRLVTADNQSTTDGSLAAFRALVKKYKPAVIIGAYTSTNTLFLKSEARRLETTLITPTASNDLITERNPFVFRACFSDSRQGAALGKYARERGLKRIGVMLDIDEDGVYSKMLGRSVGRAFEKNGGKVVIEEGYHSTDPDFKKQLRAIIATKANGILLPGYPEDVIRMIVNGRILGYKKVFFGGDGWNHPTLPRLLKRQLLGCFFSTMYSPAYPVPQVKKFAKNYKEKYRMKATMSAAQGFDTAAIVITAMSKAKGNKTRFRRQLYAIKNFPGVTGLTSFDAQGNAIKPVFIREFVAAGKKDVKAKLVKIINP